MTECNFTIPSKEDIAFKLYQTLLPINNADRRPDYLITQKYRLALFVACLKSLKTETCQELPILPALPPQKDFSTYRESSTGSLL